ncbi:isoleucine--tRNA ligase [Candidatus Dependentiae bacterium]|nr:MAG: isoleucine--tRNA ligase [Candidatus Dependentiae bacterium]
MSNEKKNNQKISFKDTLNLPHTEFPIRSNAKVDDPRMLQRWQEEDMYAKTFYVHEGDKKFILHDGPPYANGHIHLGTAANKILKDVAAKGQRMQGKQVPITPGWDCHGLPIELYVTKEIPGMTCNELIKACRAYANKWMVTQREEFKALGVFMDWEHPYLTMDYSYEAKILQAFGIFVAKGYIERKNKTVPWCASCQTVLAAAEIEYHDRRDPSIYLLFPLEEPAVVRLFPQLKGKPVHLLIWTTTPWTLPLNRAILVQPEATYQLLETDGTYLIVGKGRVDALCSLFGIEKKVIADISAQKLVSGDTKAQHPFIKGLLVPLILDKGIALDEGTALVHCAPGCGPQDYEVAIKNKLEIFSPISSDGCYTKGIMPIELEGVSVFDGQSWVLKKLADLGMLFFKTSVHHSYPYCWRCRKGLIFRATKQWFCDLTKYNLKQKALKAIDTLKMIPEKSKNHLKAAIENRLEWCLSRQRVWGAPIPALLCKQCGYAYITQELVEKVAVHVANHGIEYWQEVPIDELIPKGFVCSECSGTEFIKEQDILDVWFDSGVSHFAVLKDNPELGYPADLYLEAKDQHRGWFQSSLLTSMVIEEQPCMKTIITHGYTVDAQGRKMSKSLGNVVVPQEIIDRVGTDVLRLWMASLDYTDDIPVSDVLINNVHEVYRKIRNTGRFLLANLYDFKIDHDAVSPEKMLFIDQYALYELCEINRSIRDYYNNYDFTAVSHTLAHYCSTELSHFYLDIIKDRLYVEKAEGTLRRSAQTACWHILDTVTKLIAPILSFTAENLSDYYQKGKTQSIHLQRFNTLDILWNQLVTKTSLLPTGYRAPAEDVVDELRYRTVQEQRWKVLKDFRSAILKLIEEKREQKIIKIPLEANIIIYLDPKGKYYSIIEQTFKELQAFGQDPVQFLKEFLIVSHVEWASDSTNLQPTEFEGLYSRVEKAKGTKCPRCWQWEETEHEQGLCLRCQTVVEQIK